MKKDKYTTKALTVVNNPKKIKLPLSHEQATPIS